MSSTNPASPGRRRWPKEAAPSTRVCAQGMPTPLADPAAACVERHGPRVREGADVPQSRRHARRPHFRKKGRCLPSVPALGEVAGKRARSDEAQAPASSRVAQRIFLHKFGRAEQQIGAARGRAAADAAIPAVLPGRLLGGAAVEEGGEFGGLGCFERLLDAHALSGATTPIYVTLPRTSLPLFRSASTGTAATPLTGASEPAVPAVVEVVGQALGLGVLECGRQGALIAGAGAIEARQEGDLLQAHPVGVLPLLAEAIGVLQQEFRQVLPGIHAAAFSDALGHGQIGLEHSEVPEAGVPQGEHDVGIPKVGGRREWQLGVRVLGGAYRFQGLQDTLHRRVLRI
mmetsp:Transcript_108618/g.346767  ORF Transcript_108618/g.346767 Transcript_108618/m.346767 type:complete len:344 (+) Transcript_108618:858-1889(+)